MKNPVSTIVTKTDANRIRKKNQDKSKKVAKLHDQFRRINPKSSVDKIHRDLVDALHRAQRIAKLLEETIKEEFPGNKNRPLVTNTRVPLSQAQWKIDQAIRQLDDEVIGEAKVHYERINLIFLLTM